MKKASPELILVGLILLGLGIAGWFYGIHWKRVASGTRFSQDEKLIIQLQDQIYTLLDENERLFQEIRELTPDREPPPKGATAPGVSSPTTPSPTQEADTEKVELPQ